MMTIMRFVAGLLALTASAGASTSISGPIQVTPTQALIPVVTDQIGACTYRASENASFLPLVNDVNPALFAGSNVDSRGGSLIQGQQHVFVLGKRIADTALDGKLYSRALQANTMHWVGVTCGADPEVVQSFQTENPPLGRTAPEAPPFNASGFGNYAWPTIDWTNPNRTYIDPMTGLLLKRVTSSSWNAQANYQNTVFARAFDLNSAWTTPANVTNWPGSSGTLASYSGAASDPIFVVADISVIPSFGSVAFSGWAPLTTVDDVLVRTYGFGSDATAANRNILVCLSNDSGNTCDTPEITVTLPSGAAANGPTVPSTFPQPAWTSWASSVPYRGRDWGTVISTVTTSGTTITNTGTQSSQYFSRTWKPGGKVLVNGSEIYTIASVNNASVITTVETMPAHASPVSFKSLNSGVRIRKQTATGTVNLSVSYDLAVAQEFRMPFDGRRNLCSPATVTVAVDASGNPASPRTARLCVAPQANNSHVLFAFFGDNGEARLLSNFNAQQGFQYHSPDWVMFDGNNPRSTGYSGGSVWDNTIATRFYTVIQTSGPHYTLIRVDYTGDFRAYNPGYYTSGSWPDDKLTYNAVGNGWGSQNLAVDQQAAAFGNALFDSTVWNIYSFYGLTAENKAIWGIYEQQDDPGFIALQDVSTGTVTSVIDEITNYPLRFWGDHGLDPFAGKFTSTANILGNKGQGNRYLGGPFIVYPTQINKNGTWGDTSLTASYADACPNGISAQWLALGATGNNCILMRARQPCSDWAGARELSKFPCPWDGTKSMISALGEGDRFWTDFHYNGTPPNAGVGGGPETMRVVTTPTNLGGGIVEFWAERHSESFGGLGGAYDGSGNPGNSPSAHPSGWTGAMIPPEARTVALNWFNSDGTTLVENYALGATHADIGAGYSGDPNLTSIGAGTASFTWGIRWNKPLESQVNQSPDYSIYSNGGFGGKDNGGGSMESYVSMRQIAAPPNERRWFMDLRHMSPFSGVGQEVYAGVGAISASLVSGTINVYRFTSYPGNHTDIKRFPALAYAGPYLLQDMSSAATGNLITDSAPWKYCFAYKNAECRADSTAGQIFVSVPNADTRGIADNSCIGGWYAQANPCAWIPFAMQFWGIQVDISRLPTDDNYWRKLTIGFAGPGRQYEFGNITPTPDGTWAFMQGYWLDGVRNEILALKIPPFPGYDSVNRADYIPLPVTVGSGAGTSARARFGYAENGPPSSYFCTSRTESCVTDASVSPFAFVQSDSLTATPCSAGCSLSIPAISGRVLYYVIERLDASGAVVAEEDPQALVVP